jgi:hypothetical protein
MKSSERRLRLFRYFGVLLLLTSFLIPPQHVSAKSGMDLYFQLSDLAKSQGIAAAKAEYASLSKADQDSIAAGLAAATVKSTGGPISDQSTPVAVNASGSANGGVQPNFVSGCQGPYDWEIYSESGGRILWEFWQEITVCYSSAGWVTAAYCSAWPANIDYVISWNGFDTYCSVTYGGIGWNQIKYFSQGGFSGCVAFCYISWEPWIAQQHDHNGNYWAWDGA